MSPVALDRTDLRILAELQREGRLSNAELAERVALSPSPCLRRVQRLEQAGVIAGYAAQLDPAAVGLGLHAFVRAQLVKHDAEGIDRFVRLVGEWDEVVACHALTGDMDYLLRVQVTDLAHFSRFMMGRLLEHPGVVDVKSSIALEIVKHTVALPVVR